MARRGVLIGLLALAGAGLVGLSFAANEVESGRRLEARARTLTGGDPDAGREAIQRRPCGGCHEIPGVPGARGKVGPPLTHFAGRVYIGGRAQNTPENLILWIQNPHLFDPRSAMPPMGIGEAEARDIAAYLYTLE
jgi:cytochrome c2